MRDGRRGIAHLLLTGGPAVCFFKQAGGVDYDGT